MTTKRFDNAYTALVNAFFNGTLAKGTCVACAVGNIVAYNQGGKISEFLSGFRCTVNNINWKFLFTTTDGIQKYRKYLLSPKEINKILEKEIKPTGYSEDELAKVEFAFETNTNIHFTSYNQCTKQEILEDQYKGLCAVVDILLQLDNLQNDGHKEKFREHPGLLQNN